MSYRDRGERGPSEPPLPKPYEFVPLPQGRLTTEPPAGHHRYKAGNLTGTLTATIIARSPVHVASGLLEPKSDRQYPMVKGHFRTGGTPAIPGTSLKGCVRSIVEAISRSSVQVTRARELPRDYQPSRQIDRLDVAQRIFGALGYQGLVRFGDATLESDDTIIVPSVQLFRPRSEAVDTYFDGRQPRGRKFYMHGKLAEGNLPLEACPIGSQFSLRMQFENLTPGELGLVLIALGLGEPGFLPKLGGAKPACLGTIEVADAALTTLETGAAYDEFDATPAPLEPQPLLEAAKPLVLNTQLGRLAEVLRWPRDDGRACPDRSY
jgi:CRISPR/Cas system CSM-associated protein Csm3 (group 7 of RAMP superfamily)